MTQWQPDNQPRHRAGQPPVTPPQWGGSHQGPPQPQWVPLEQRPGYGQPQPGWQPPQYQPPQYAPQPPPRKKSRVGLFAGLGCGGLAALVIVVVAVAAGSSSSSPSPSPAAGAQQTQAAAPAATKSAAAAETVTYEVTGSYADVTYGPAGSDFSGSVPLHVTKPIGTPSYYSITAQLQGGGTVSCKILVGGKVISQATASGGYNIASCEISQGFLGGWQDTNG